MPDNDQESRRDIDFENLNTLGKAVFLTGAAVRVTSKFLDSALHRAADLAVETERAFRQGLDPNTEDAKILDEREHPRPGTADRADRPDEDGS